MKKILFLSIAALLAGSSYAQFGQPEQNKNPLLNADFWDQKPTLTLVQAEVAKGNDPAEKNGMQFDATYVAIQNGASLEVVKYLIDKSGNDVNKQGHERLTYVHAAAAKGNVEVLQYLLSKGAKPDVETQFGMTPIVFAVNNGQTNPAIYEAFFKAGVSPKQKYTNGANLLLLGIANDKDLKLTDYFITKGLSLKDVDDKGRTAFDYAAKNGNIELLKTLNAKGVKHTNNVLLIAAEGSRMKSNTIEIYKYLVDDLKVDPAATDGDGQNVLHILVKKQKQDDIISYFLGKGLNINQTDKDGNTVFMAAATTKNTELITALLPKVQNINATNNTGESALSNAIKSGTVETAKLLFNSGADIKIVNSQGNNLAFALVQAHRTWRGGRGGNDDTSDKLKFLKSSGLDVTATRKDGSTLYHIAASKNDIVALKALEEFGININAKNSEGLTALQKSALVSKNDEILKYLLSIGADKSIKDDMDETAYDLAKQNEFLTKGNVSVDFLK